MKLSKLKKKQEDTVANDYQKDYVKHAQTEKLKMKCTFSCYALPIIPREEQLSTPLKKNHTFTQMSLTRMNYLKYCKQLQIKPAM